MIPKQFVDRYLKEASGATFFGMPINELSRDELIAMAISGWKAEREAIKDSQRSIKFLMDLRKAKNGCR